jgi:MFS family permease
MRRFWVIWFGQVVTFVGNSVLRFAFVVQAWAAGERATQVVLLAVCAALPMVLLSPVAGAVVDRLRKRTALRLADLGGLVTVGVLSAVYFSGHLQLWNIYLVVVLLGATAAFQYPALMSALPLLVPKAHLQRANGMLAAAKSTSDVGGPALAGVLIAASGLGVILWVDLASFVVALICVQVVRFADEPSGADSGRPRRKLFADSLEGLRYLFAQPSLRAITLIFFVVNLVMVLGFAVIQPMILARTGNDTAVLASVLTSIGIGGIAGGLVLGAWGGPKSRVRGMMLGVIGMCLFSQVLVATVHGVVAWCVAVLAGAMLVPMVNGAMQTIIQTKVAPERQGRVFGAVLFTAQISAPLAMASSGPLADHVFEPQAATGSGLVGLLQPLVGTGPGSGMAAMMLIAGVFGAGVAVWGMRHRPIRDIDLLIPDLDSPGESTNASESKGAGVSTGEGKEPALAMEGETQKG